MRKNILRVLRAFEQGQAAIGDSKRTCWTDGETVYSYDMPIMQRLPNGAIEIVSYDTGPTRTTKAQIRACQVNFTVYNSIGYHALFVEVDTLTGYAPHTFRSRAGASGYQDRK